MSVTPANAVWIGAVVIPSSTKVPPRLSQPLFASR
jgi:hypothetical protein